MASRHFLSSLDRSVEEMRALARTALAYKRSGAGCIADAPELVGRVLALLFFSAIGSELSSRLTVERARSLSVGATLVGVLLTAFVVPIVTEAAHGWPHTTRIVLAVTLIAPLGVVMGMVYPTGVRLLDKYELAHLGPWAWAINGVCSVFASTFGMLLAINFVYTVLILCGGLAYAMTGWSAMKTWHEARARA